MKISAKQYALTLYELTEEKGDAEIKDIVANFVNFMKKRGDFKKLSSVVTQFTNIYNNKHSIIEATVITARGLDSQEEENVRSFIKRKYSANSVIINSVVNENVKGGIIIRVGDEILDGSVSARLKKLQANLSK